MGSRSKSILLTPQKKIKKIKRARFSNVSEAARREKCKIPIFSPSAARDTWRAGAALSDFSPFRPSPLSALALPSHLHSAHSLSFPSFASPSLRDPQLPPSLPPFHDAFVPPTRTVPSPPPSPPSPPGASLATSIFRWRSISSR